MNTYNVIGLMSGTSVDGLDVCYCTFSLQNGNWSMTIGAAQTVEYSSELESKLKNAIGMTALELSQLNVDFGQYIGHAVNKFIQENDLEKSDIDALASHGHTVYHQPSNKLTLQIGDGASIAAITGIKVINDFRTLDVALGGNGAPLVPIGDRLLYGSYDACLNLGGFANISFEQNEQRIAFDVAPVNIVLNALAQKMGQAFDENGKMAREGEVNMELLNSLNQLPYYHESPPKSLGFEWVNKHIFPLLEKTKLETSDLLRTFTEHAAIQIANSLPQEKSVLVTGGGTYNSFLIERIQTHSSAKLVIPADSIVEFKEALIFGFLGVLRLRNEINTLKSVTGATQDSVGGSIYNPFSIS